MAKAADVFISYSREDKESVLSLAAKLREAGVTLWIDQGGIELRFLIRQAVIDQQLVVILRRRVNGDIDGNRVLLVFT